MRPDPSGIQDSALWHFHDYQRENRQLTLLQLDESLYRSASFLDQRIEPAAEEIAHLDFESLDACFPSDLPARQSTMFIFHIGHCGSTLLSRALAASSAVLPVREPLTLRRLAAERRSAFEDRDSMMGHVLRALSRAFNPGQKAMVKATSTCNNLIHPVLSFNADSRAVAMYVPLEAYLAGMLGKQRPALDLRGHLAARLEDWDRIAQAADPGLDENNEAQLAALAWVTSMHSILNALERHPHRLRLLDFEAFLQDTQTHLSGTAGFFGLNDAVPGILEAYPDISTGYSKKPDEPYSAFNRRRTLQRGRMNRSQEIDFGLKWADELAGVYPALRNYF
jgi:hypothetical protein